MSKTINKILLRAANYAEQIGGKKARESAMAAKVVRTLPLPAFEKARVRVNRIAEVDAGRTRKARIHFGTRAGIALGAAVAGSRAYREHEDNKILKRIDKLYDDRVHFG